MTASKEAHPAEEANFTGNIEISSHQNFEEKLAAAGILLDKMAGRMEVDRIPLLVDTMANTLSKVVMFSFVSFSNRMENFLFL